MRFFRFIWKLLSNSKTGKSVFQKREKKNRPWKDEDVEDADYEDINSDK